MPYDIIVGRNDADKKLFGKKGLINLGKGYVQMGQYTSLSNPIYMDVARSHVVLISGKRGSGKCLHGDTLISLGNGSQIPIKELENNSEHVLSLNNKLKVESTKKSDFFSRQVQKLLKIKLRSGKEIKLTPEHPLLTIKGWKPVSELFVGGRIATPRKTCFGGNSLPEHEIKLLSYLIAEGHTKKVVLFSNKDEKIISDFKESLYNLDPNLKLIKEKEGQFRISQPNWRNKVVDQSCVKRNERGQFTNKSKNIYEKRSIRKLIEREKLFGLLATEKFLSESIMELKEASLSLFLNRLFSCDGSVYQSNNYWEISYSSSSDKLIKQIQSLLLKFGILSRLRNKEIRLNGKRFITYELVINSTNALKFIENIGFFGIKEDKQEIAKREIELKIKNPNVDTIPKEIWETHTPKNWVEVGKAMNYKYPKAARERLRYSPSRQTLLQVAKVENYNPFYLLATSDIFWDEIVSMEILEGEFEVYDICVPDNHNFVANDIIVHNSYTLGSIAEGISDLPHEAKQNIAPLIFDTMGIFWTMKYKNEKDKELLRKWDLAAKDLPAKVFVPFGYFEEYLQKGVKVDVPFALKVSDMKPEDWVLMFGLGLIDPVAVLIQRTIFRMETFGEGYDIDDIITNLKDAPGVSPDVINAAVGLFEAAISWRVFAKKGMEETKISDLITPGTTGIIDLSVYSSIGAFNVRALVIGLVCRKLFNSRMMSRKQEEVEAVSHGVDYLAYSSRREMPLVWILIDEAHEFLPKDDKTSATDSLIQILREGRQPGLSLVLATQQPGQIHKDVMTQSDIIISHRLTAEPDIVALNEIMQSYLLEGIKQSIDNLPNLKGSAIILDDNSERLYPMRVRPRFTWHGGEAPSAVKADTGE